jgi:hypothetical protein
MQEGNVETKKPVSRERAEGQPAAKARPKRKWRKRSVAPGRQAGSPEARKKAAAILEVLAGARSPTEAAEALGISPMCYYVMESRALQGLLESCEPRPRGPRPDPEKRVARLERQMDTLRRDSARYQALARASHRTLGIAPVKATQKTKSGARKRRRPVVRALKAVAGFRGIAGEAKALPAGAAQSAKTAVGSAGGS